MLRFPHSNPRSDRSDENLEQTREQFSGADSAKNNPMKKGRKAWRKGV